MRVKVKKTAEEWLELVEDHQKSGKSLSEYCQGAEFTYDQLRYWRDRYGITPKRKAANPKKSPGFARVTPVIKGVGSGNIVIRYNGGTALELPSNYDLNQLITLVKLGEC